jgi:1-acyl-sn-glycerol-3-phosphate acyltransferase
VTPTAAGAVVEEQVLDIVAGLVAELAGGAVQRPALNDSLDRDLGISSLERVELLLRLEQACGVRLPDSVMAEAATPKELVTAILRAAPAAPEAAPTAHQSTTPSAPAPTSARTLVDVLRWHAERTPNRIHIHLRQDAGTEAPITYGELLDGSMTVSAGLRTLGVGKGDRVALMLRTEPAFFPAFCGTIMAGAVPVPIYPPFRADQIEEYARRQRIILRNAGARALITFDAAERVAALIRGQVPSLEAVTTMPQLAGQSAGAVTGRPDANDPALIQYTSGSTGDPKGVLLSHGNILANIRAIGQAIDIRPDDVSVSWLPLYHDMGLIGAWLGSLYFGVPIALMSPLAFLARPARWLWTIHAHHGTVSPAPNFAFDLCVRKIADEEIDGLDLAGWRLALNGSEVVSPETIERFTRRFAPYGFRPEAMCPVYGLAESSVGLTVSPIGRLPHVDRIAREPFERAREVRGATVDEPRPLQFVSCGRPLSGHDVRIVDASGQMVGDRIEGHVQFRGPSVTLGYFRNPEATREATHDGWMDSGDLGYRAGGELFLTGREKDLIIKAGRNIYAQEIEEIAGEVPGIRKGCVAAFGLHDPAIGTEHLIVVAETKDRNPARREALQRAVRDQLVSGIGLPPDTVVIADPGTVLKTPSGKIRRGAIRDAYSKGTLGARHPVAWQWSALAIADLQARAGRFAGWLGRVLFTSYVLLVLLVTLPVFWTYLGILRPGRRADRATKRWSQLVLTLCGFRPRVTGLANLNGLRSGILLANHASYIDPIVLMATIPAEFRFIAKRALTDYPLIGTVIRKAQHSTIEKSRMTERLAGAEEVAKRLHEGELLVVFPEGTFVRAPGLLPFRLGAFRAAVDAGRPIVSVAIRGTRHVLPDGTWLFRHGTIDVTIGVPLQPQGQGWPEMVRLRDRALDEIARGSGESAGVRLTTS